MAATPDEIRERARKVRLVLMDADGVLTDGRIIVFADGNEARSYFARDGLGIRMGQQGGLDFGVVSGRSSPAVEARARELDFVEIHQKVAAKGGCLVEIARRRGLGADEICFVGDDLVDVPAFRRCGLAVAPADADRSILEHVHHVGTASGGRGIVREVIELILRAKGGWERVAAPYLAGKE
ncbi:MAG TPA: HAD family hydrolase [Candidatus Polarisedimenticolaceae bacterium]|nr:HAD family hydrolase [Candidatus Polarisedimenticolaceae bacterium]